jgi:hypothetical protein
MLTVAEARQWSLWLPCLQTHVKRTCEDCRVPGGEDECRLSPTQASLPMGSPPARRRVGAVWEQAETLMVSACTHANALGEGGRLARVRVGTKLALSCRRRQKTVGSQRLPSFVLSCYPRSVPTGRSLDALPSLPPVSGFLLQTSKALAAHAFVAPLAACQSVRPAAFRPRVRVSIDLPGGTMMIRKPCSRRVATSTIGLTLVAQGTSYSLQMARILSRAASTSG